MRGSGNFNITLNDTDGSEVIDLIQIKNVPATYSFSTGTLIMAAEPIHLQI